MSLGNDPRRVTSEADVEAAEAVAAARQERHELARGGSAPSVEAILREMGRDADGYEVAEGPDEWVSASEAGRRALDRLDAVEEAGRHGRT
jgi:hypothetical protein